MTGTTAPTSARRTHTRARLMDAAFEVFAENGFAGASLELICERAGLTRGAFYYNFEAKEDLFLAVMEREFETRMSVLVAASADLGLRELVELVGSLYSTPLNHHITWATLTEEFRLRAMRDPAAARAYSQQFRVIHQRLAVALQQVASNHGLRMLAPPETIAEITVRIYLKAVIEGVLAGEDDEEVLRIAAERITVTLEGLIRPLAP